MKWVVGVLVLILAIALILFFVNYPKLDFISGYSAKYMLSQLNIAKREASTVSQIDLDAPLINLADVKIDGQKVTASVYGLKKRSAIYREGLGGVLLNGEGIDPINTLIPQRESRFDSLPYPYGHLPAVDRVFDEIDYNRLDEAVGVAFSNEAIQRTRSLVILYKGHLLSESYSGHINEATPVLGWSMTKSLLATCFGILDFQGKLDLTDPAPVEEWQNDDRKNITVDNLLRMQSGLKWSEDYDKISDVTKMLFKDSDMSVAQINKELVAQPTEIWNYSSGTSNLLSGILRSQSTDQQTYLDFPYLELLDRIGAHSFLIETDLKGNFVGSSYGWATTRDWARLGQLYLDRGLWNGERIFHPEWVDYVTTPTEHSNGEYGAHFWLNAGSIYPDVPKDLYSMNGFQGQYVFIIPSKDLVVVRTGLAEHPEFDINAFLSTLCSAVK